ncbi:hypothetical protein GQ53DRAFT_458264 [Thozetella sp. PMI_491]|nr:hypothetical protein GQ53DRAFT_458264 [Thozetella sp. PMI_491]
MLSARSCPPPFQSLTNSQILIPIALASSVLSIPNVNAVFPVTPSPGAFVGLAVLFAVLYFIGMYDWGWCSRMLWRWVTSYLREKHLNPPHNGGPTDDGQSRKTWSSDRPARIPSLRRMLLPIWTVPPTQMV